MDNFSYFQSRLDLINNFGNSIDMSLNEDSNLEEFLEMDRKNFFGKDHYLFRWEKFIPKEQIEKILVNLQLLPIDASLVNIEILERGISGRVTALKIVSVKPSQEIILLKDDIRRTLSFLPSNLFVIDKKDDDLWHFKGGGFGHGVGLSQSGAIEMAKAGFSYERILDHYYRGTNILSMDALKY